LDAVNEEGEHEVKINTAIHLQIDGQMERVNEILDQYICNYIVSDHKD
jgi:hypothetical protein